MGDAVLDWLLEEDNPSVRYFALTGLLGKKDADPGVLRARKSIIETGAVPRMLELRNDEGCWGAPGSFYSDKYRGTVWQVLVLAELGADGADARVAKACECLLASSQSREGGGFSAKESARGSGGLSSMVVPCLTGNMAFSLVRLGLGDDPRVKAAIEWICEYQRFDDGVAKPPRGDPYDRYEMCWGKHSCHMGVVKAMKALAAVPARKRGARAKAVIAEGTEYLLAHRVYKKSHDLSSVSKPGWLKFGFPLMYQTDALEILGILARLGCRDERMGDALEVLREARGEDGRWAMRNSFNGKMLVDIEKKGAPSKWITLKALEVLKACGSLL